MREERIRELGLDLERVLERHPEMDRDTVWRFLLNLERPPLERLQRSLQLGKYSLFRKVASPAEGAE